MSTLAQQIAERILAVRYQAISQDALDWTASAFVDTVGVTLAGVREEGPRILMRVPGIAAAPGPALILGTARRTSVLDAAQVNGVAAHALDFDDVAGSMGGHPSAMLVPALIPLAEMLGSSGRELVVAYVAGFETACRIGRGVHYYHYEKGWHPTATLGIFGTVAGAARLLKLSVAQSVRPHRDMPEDWGTEVIIETTDGARFASRLDDYRSRGPDGDPMTHAELWTKFADCAARSLPRDNLSGLFDTLLGIGRLAGVGELTALLEGRL